MIIELICKHCPLSTCLGVKECHLIKKARDTKAVQQKKLPVAVKKEQKVETKISKHGKGKEKKIPPKIENFLEREGFLSNIPGGVITLRIRVLNAGDDLEIYQKINGKKEKKPYFFKNDLHLKKGYKCKFIDGKLI